MSRWERLLHIDRHTSGCKSVLAGSIKTDDPEGVRDIMREVPLDHEDEDNNSA
ncbi:hypothetical protein Ga0061069_109108 [Thiomonas bhubaneswarensis]|uniref:Uncharacterized protein n=1 Tax=Thiomonas bhubaneswarensis TaxID=339866 RepID=A0A0K6I8H7_9BURK|nr:hypothetical protein Ga0061069_109108 [Thiomonas bhubaneswarensis]